MDYKYIHQLLDRYFDALTSADEESVLRAFFRQKELPADLEQYRPVFADDLEDIELSHDFDDRILALIEPKTAPVITFRQRLMPLMRAAAAVIVIVMVGNVARLTMPQPAEQPTMTASQSDTYIDPDVAYDKVRDALHLVSEAMNQADSINNDTIISKQ